MRFFDQNRKLIIVLADFEHMHNSDIVIVQLVILGGKQTKDVKPALSHRIN